MSETAAETLVVDSWLAVDGRVLALARHAGRFADSVAEVGGDRLDALATVRRAMAEVPRGRWWPRVDFDGEAFTARLREAPAASDRVTVVTASRDPRTMPLRKGPDLVALGELQAAESADAGTSVEPILAPGGAVAEGTWSALMWWRDDVLHVPGQQVPRLPSVTAAVIEDVARLDGVEVVHEQAEPADLEGCEVWLANAVRGIRGVYQWLGGPVVAAPQRVSHWRERLAALAVPAPSWRG